MNGNGFDDLTLRLETGLPRRSTLALISGAVAALLVSRNRSALAGCKQAGRKCDKSKDCCDGARCKGGKKGKCRCKSGLNECSGVKGCKNLGADPNHCGSCGNACPPFVEFCVASECKSCPAGADHCTSPTASCQNDPGCFCLKRLEDGVPICADLPRCGNPCDSDADCGIGASDCVSAGAACCPGSVGQGRCAERCGA